MAVVSAYIGEILPEKKSLVLMWEHFQVDTKLITT
jgi:hypothetical protein